MRALPSTVFRLSCTCLLFYTSASSGVAQTPRLRGRWVADSFPVGLDFRAGDTVWQLIPIAAISANGRGTYEYAQGRLISHWGEGLYDTATVTLCGDTLVLALDNDQKETKVRIAPARGGRSPLHGTWVGPFGEGELRLVTYLPGEVFFQEGALVEHYEIEGRTVTMTTGGTPAHFQIQVRGADTVLTSLEGGGKTFRRSRCDDPRLDPRKAFISACS